MATLKASKRSEVGSRPTRRLRKQGLVPGVIYGHGEDPENITVSSHDIDVSVQHGERLLDLELDGEHQSVLIKDVQWDVFGHHILHVDLTRVNLDEKVEVTVPVELRGTPAEEGVLQQQAAEVNLRCTVRSIPEVIRVAVHDLTIGDRITAGELELPEGSELVDEADMLVCNLTYVSEEVEEEEGEEAAADLEPELIGEKKEEDQGAEEEE